MDLVEPFFKVFLLVFFAEFGDKSQLVCMTLSARHSVTVVLIGSFLAFSVLNLIAVLFGASIASYLPEVAVFLIVGVLFLVFGLQALWDSHGEMIESPRLGRSLMISVFLLIFFAELGDKTQLAVAGMAAVEVAWLVWLAGTLALCLTSLLGVWFGHLLLQRVSVKWINRAAGILFVGFSVLAFRLFYLEIV